MNVYAHVMETAIEIVSTKLQAHRPCGLAIYDAMELHTI
jgi:hypothetical protein